MCEHNWQFKASINIENLVYDIYFCTKCLEYAKKERPCPYDIQDLKT